MTENRHPFAGQVPGIYRRRVGNCEVTAVNDGYIEIPDDYWHGITNESLHLALKAAHLPAEGIVRHGITAFAINTGSQLILIDSGPADLIGPTGGHYKANLEAAGIDPHAVGMILLTHLHPDHVAGLVKDGAPLCPNATVHVNATDQEHFASDTAKAQAPAGQQGWYDVARGFLSVYGERVQPLTGEASLGHGITAVPLPGHTPGHTGFLLESEGERILFWGDTAMSNAVHFAHPDALLAFDMDPDTTRRTRLETFERASREGLLCVGTHLPFPTFGYVDRLHRAFAWVPEEWRYAG